MKNLNKTNRRKFFQSAGIGAFGVLIAKVLPFNFLKSSVIEPNSIPTQVSIHPLAVKRNKRG